MRASSEDNFYKAGWWNGIDDPEAGLKGHALATNAIYSKLLGTDFTVESDETPEPTPNPDTKPDTGKDTQSPETGDGMTVTVWVMAATLSVAAVLVLSAKKREDRSSSQIAIYLENSPLRLRGGGGCFFGGLPEMGKCGMILKNIFPGGAL